MKKIADFLVTVALICITILFHLVPAQSQELRNPVKHEGSLPNKCTAPATPLISETSVAAAGIALVDHSYLHTYPGVSLAQLKQATTPNTIINLGLVAANQPFHNLLQVPNPIDDTRFFVQQHYRDFLMRDPPDQPGWDFWSGQITQCGSDAACIAGKRIDVSRAFFFDDNFVASQFPINPGLSSPRGLDTYNRAFVRQCYLTYLRREPNAPPDNNFGGFDFWLGVLNGHGSPTPTEGYNHLIEAFLLSGEYRTRFVSPPC
jgi:hypothetical protein